jgi:hypothetical protein
MERISTDKSSKIRIGQKITSAYDKELQHKTPQSKGRWSYITSGASHSQKGDVSKLFIFRP